MNNFELNDTNELLERYYQKDNYKIEINQAKNKKCIIFFSGNGLYYPDTEESFHEIIVKKDRYEWERVAQSEIIREHFEMAIFVRDIYKSFYVKGINSQYSTIDKLLSFLKDLTKGYTVVTCGNSAGGYMASIAGDFLGAEIVFNFGGLWNIKIKKNYFLEKFSHVDECNKYYDIAHLAKENHIWFYSALNEGDNEQKELLGVDFGKLLSIGVESKYHGDLLFFPCYERLLVYTYDEVVSLYHKYKNKIVSKRKIAREFLGGTMLIEEYKKDFIHHHKSLQKLQSILEHIHKR